MKVDTLSHYLSRILRFPILDAEQERTLARDWRERGDVEALERLVNSHLRLVVRIARDFKGYGLPMEDLIAAGNLGLTEAARRFDPGRGVRFATCALWWIRAAILEYVMRNGSLVKIGTTPERKRLFFKLRRLKSLVRAMKDGDLRPEEAALIASELRVPEAEVIEMNRRLSAPDASLNELSGESEELERIDLVVDDRPDPEACLAEAEEAAHRRRMLARILTWLGERERRIILERRLAERPTALHVLGRRFGVSGERIRQIEARALDKMRKAIAAETGPARAA